MRFALLKGLAMAVCAAPMLAGCVIAIDGDDDDDIRVFSGRYETLLAAEVSPRKPEVAITATSNGCTREADFQPRVKRDDGVYRVGFERREPDRCKALMPEGARLVWSFAQLGVPDGAPLIVVNPVGR